MEKIGRFAARYAIWVVICFILVGGIVAWIGVDPGSEDDVLRFLPKTNPDVGRFYHVNEKFGALNVALVGVEVEDIYNRDFMRRLDHATRTLQNEVPGVHRVLSLTSLSDFVLLKGKKGGIQPRVLVDVEHLPSTEEGWRKYEKQILAREHVVGQFVNPEGTATVLVCYLAPKGNINKITNDIRAVVNETFPDANKYWGGTPFISSHIFAVTEKDMETLTPWAVAMIILVTLLTFRDPIGVLLALVATVFGGAMTFALMNALGVKLNIVLGSMPVILFAVGSAYGIHFLVRYYALRKDEETEEAIVGSFRHVGPGILAAGLTTIAGFVSFLAMDIEPMREFGLFTGIGIGCCLLAAVLLIPAVLALSGRKRKWKEKDNFLKRGMVAASRWAARNRIPVAVGLGLLAVGGIYYSSQVELAVSTASFFREGSEPDIANKFLKRQFGGSMYVQIHLKADLDDPVVLKQIRRMAGHLETVEHVSSVQHVGMPFSLVSRAWVELRRIPDTRKRVSTLANYVLTDPASLQLMTRDRDEALVHVKVRTTDADELNRVLEEVRAIVKRHFGQDLVAVDLSETRSEGAKRAARRALAEMVADEVVARLRRAGAKKASKHREQVADKLFFLQTEWEYEPDDRDIERVAERIHRHLRSDEAVIPLPPADPNGDPANKLATALAKLGPRATPAQKDEIAKKVLTGALDEDSALSLVATLEPYLEDAWRLQRSWAMVRKLSEPLGIDPSKLKKKARDRVQVALLDLQADRIAIRQKQAKAVGATGDEVPVQAFLTGMPVLHQGLAESVKMNQIKSLVVSGTLVLIVMGLIFRSMLAGLLAIVPAGMTILLIFGFMGLKGLYLDMSTSMIASIALGVGIDYAIHFMVWWKRAAQRLAPELGGAPTRKLAELAAGEASGQAGTAILANALMVASAFVILATGDAAPMRLFGGMTAGSMLVAATMAFAAVPALAGKTLLRRWVLTEEPTEGPAPEAEEKQVEDKPRAKPEAEQDSAKTERAETRA
jgi:hypothetical protein